MVSTPTRVYVDTNVIFSAIISSAGPPGLVVALHSMGKVQMVVSRRVLQELTGTVESKAPTFMPLLKALLITSPPEVIRNPTEKEVGQSLLQGINPGDAAIWAAVLLAQPDYFVTGDAAFLREARAAQTAIRVLTPREFIDEFERGQ